MDEVYELCGFNWDDGNRKKNWIKHGVTEYECEEVFGNQPLVVKEDIDHSQSEERFFALGRTNKNRMLYIVFTKRGEQIRVVSARDMDKKERMKYGEN
jgi:hypothetical protein